MNFWPSLKGEYNVINHEGDVAVITRSSVDLHKNKLFNNCKRIAIIGSCITENTDIDKLIFNVITNGKIRNIVICGDENKKHDVGDALSKLVIEGIDENKKIIKASGEDPKLSSKRQMIERFREQILHTKTIDSKEPDEIIKLVNEMPVENILDDYHYESDREIDELLKDSIKADKNKLKFKEDRKGYFIIELMFNNIVVKHKKRGQEYKVVVGNNAEEICNKLIELKLVSSLSHAMYLGRELKRAEYALKHSRDYVQDAESFENVNNEGSYLKTTFVEANNLSDAWLKAITQLYLHGEDYIVGKFADAKTKDLPLVIHVNNTGNEPLIHEAAPKAEFKDKYDNQFIDGKNVDSDNEFISTYYSRLKHRYDCKLISNLPNVAEDKELKQATKNCKDCELVVIDQIEEAIKLLQADPTLRSVDLVTWMPYKDLDLKKSPNSPSLILIQPRINKRKLDFFVVFKSQDIYAAFPSNSYALYKLQEYMAKRLNIELGSYTQFNVSAYIYDNEIDRVEELLRHERLI